MRMRLFHGRTDPLQEMKDWGFEGPKFEFAWMSVTYGMSTVRVGFATNEDFDAAKRMTGWEEWDELTLRMEMHENLVVTHDGPNGAKRYFGDFDVDEST